jgi:hypothetical protein
MHLLDKSQYKKVLRDACRSARETDGSEICGLIIDTDVVMRYSATNALKAIDLDAAAKARIWLDKDPSQRPRGE